MCGVVRTEKGPEEEKEEVAEEGAIISLTNKTRQQIYLTCATK